MAGRLRRAAPTGLVIVAGLLVVILCILVPALLLRSVWPAPAPGEETTRKDHYCNLILNLQKVAYEARTIELPELRNACGSS